MANEKISNLNVQPSPSNFATLVGLDNGETVQIPISALGNGSSSGGGTSSGGGIVTVTELPTEGVTDTIYKVMELDGLRELTYSVENGVISGVDYLDGAHVIVVDELPEVGEAVVNFKTFGMCFYYVRNGDGKLKGYVDEEIQTILGSQGIETEVGWATDDLFEMLGMPNTIIVVESFDDVVITDTPQYLAVKKPHLYIYEGGWIEIPIGFRLVYNPVHESITIIES